MVSATRMQPLIISILSLNLKICVFAYSTDICVTQDPVSAWCRLTPLFRRIRFRTDGKSCCSSAHPVFESTRVRPNSDSIQPMSAVWPLTYLSSPGRRARYYAELAVSSQQWPKPPPVLIAPIPTEGWPGWVGLRVVWILRRTRRTLCYSQPFMQVTLVLC